MAIGYVIDSSSTCSVCGSQAGHRLSVQRAVAAPAPTASLTAGWSPERDGLRRNRRQAWKSRGPKGEVHPAWTATGQAGETPPDGGQAGPSTNGWAQPHPSTDLRRAEHEVITASMVQTDLRARLLAARGGHWRQGLPRQGDVRRQHKAALRRHNVRLLQAAVVRAGRRQGVNQQLQDHFVPPGPLHVCEISSHHVFSRSCKNETWLMEKSASARGGQG